MTLYETAKSIYDLSDGIIDGQFMTRKQFESHIRKGRVISVQCPDGNRVYEVIRYSPDEYSYRPAGKPRCSALYE